MSLRVRLRPIAQRWSRGTQARAGAHVLGARPDEAVVVVLLDDVGGPARDAAGRDDRGEEIDGDAEGVEEGRRVEVDVGDEALGLADAVVQLHRHLVPLELPGLAAGLLGHAPQDGRPRIAGVVYAMAEAHQPALLGQRPFGEGVDVGHLADLHQRAHDRLARAAMQRSLERAHAAGHGRVHVGLRRGDDAGGVRGGVQLVLGVEGQAGVEGLHGDRRRALAAQHVEEVRRVPEVRRGRHRLLAAPDAMVSADGRGHLAGEPDGLAQVGGVRVVGGVGVVHAEDGRGRLQHAHGVGVLGHQAEGVEQRAGDLAGGDQLGGDPVELGGLGQLAVPQEVDDFLERRLTGQVVDAVAAVGEASVGAVEIAELGLGGDDALEPADELDPSAMAGLLDLEFSIVSLRQFPGPWWPRYDPIPGPPPSQARSPRGEMGPLGRAGGLEPFPTTVRTLDALHLASMDSLLRSSGQRVELASYDHRLIKKKKKKRRV